MRATLGVLAAIAKRLTAAGNDTEALEGLRRETHKIHGSAGSFGFMEASRLAAGMEATAKDWIARPGDTDMDRGGLSGWFVTRLAEMLKLPIPEAPSASPPRLVIRRPSAAQKAAAPPASASKPLAPAVRPEPPKASPPKSPPKVAPVIPRRPPQPQSAPRPAPSAPPPPPPPTPRPAPPKPALKPPPKAEPKPPPAPPPKPEPQPAPKPSPESMPWLVSPEESKPAKRPPEAAPPPAAVVPSKVAPQPTPASDSAGPELILVEDDPALAELLEYGLRARGYRFVSYRNGRDALRELLALDVGATHPVVLLDVDLPGLDGYSVLDGLQRDRPGVFRVVFTTVHGGEAEQLRGLEAGALDYLVKPISLRVALEKIRRWVGR